MQKIGIILEKRGIYSIFEKYINEHDLIDVVYNKIYLKWEILDNCYYYEIIFNVVNPKNSLYHWYATQLFDKKQKSMNIYEYRYSFFSNQIHIYIRKDDVLKMERNIKLKKFLNENDRTD